MSAIGGDLRTAAEHADVDAVDGKPVRPVRPGAELVPGIGAMDRLGVGHRCETWLGWSWPLWCPVVVKLPRLHQLSHPRARQTLVREAAALAANPHPVLPRLFADRTAAERPHVILEYIDGPALDQVIDEQIMDAGAVALLGTHLLTGARMLHKRGLAHLDIKPENVILRDGRPVLVDFGTARPVGARQPAGRPVGTAGYASPEMEACAAISVAMDVYGVGATLREAYSGISCYDPNPERARLAADPPYPPGQPALVALLRALLAPDPADRPTVFQALEALADLFIPELRPWPTRASPQ